MEKDTHETKKSNHSSPNGRNWEEKLPRWESYSKAIETLLTDFPLTSHFTKLSVNIKGSLMILADAKEAERVLDNLVILSDPECVTEDLARSTANECINLMEMFCKNFASKRFKIEQTTVDKFTIGAACKCFLDMFNQYCPTKNLISRPFYLSVIALMFKERNIIAHPNNNVNWGKEASMNRIKSVLSMFAALNMLSAAIIYVKNNGGIRFQSQIPGSFELYNNSEKVFTLNFGDGDKPTDLFPNPFNHFACCQLVPGEKTPLKWEVDYEIKFISNGVSYDLGTRKFSKNQFTHFWFIDNQICKYSEYGIDQDLNYVEWERILLNEDSSLLDVQTDPEISEPILPFNYRNGSEFDVENFAAEDYKNGKIKCSFIGEDEQRQPNGSFIFERNGLIFTGYTSTKDQYECIVKVRDVINFKGTVDPDFNFLNGTLSVNVKQPDGTNMLHSYTGEFCGYNLRRGSLLKSGKLRYLGYFKDYNCQPYYEGPGIYFDKDGKFVHWGQFSAGKAVGFGIRMFCDETVKLGNWNGNVFYPVASGSNNYMALKIKTSSKCSIFLNSEELFTFENGEEAISIERGVNIRILLQFPKEMIAIEHEHQSQLWLEVNTGSCPDTLALVLP